MDIAYKKLDGTTQSGHEKFEFFCRECGVSFWFNFHWFYDQRLTLGKRDKSQAEEFCFALNNGTLKKLTDNKKLRWQIYSAVCNCSEESRKVVDPEERLRVLRAKKLIDPTVKISDNLIRMVKLKQPENVRKFWDELESLGAEVRELIYEGNKMWGFKIYTDEGGYLDYGTKREILDLVKGDNGKI